MDYLAVSLIGLIGLNFALITLVLKIASTTGKYQAEAEKERRRADELTVHNTLLLEDVKELKGLVAGADFAALRAVNQYHKLRGELKRAKSLLAGK